MSAKSADPRDDPKPLRTRRKEARPQELTEAALGLFVEKGFAATCLEDVASRAGVSKGTLYLYFSSKEALFEAVIREGILPVIETGESLVASHQGSAAALLKDLMDGWWQMVGASPLGGVPKLMMSEAGNFPEVAAFYRENVIERGHRLVGATLERGIANGEFRPVDIPSTIAVLFSPLLMMAILRYSLGPCGFDDPDKVLQTHLDIVLHGLSAPGVSKESQ